MSQTNFNYTDIRFADIQMLRYHLNGFEALTLKQKLYIYYLSQAALCGRDITTDQFCKYNLIIRKTLEQIYLHMDRAKDPNNCQALEDYLRCVWFANGIHHHYSNEKFKPTFTQDFFKAQIQQLPTSCLQITADNDVDAFIDLISSIIFDTTVMPKKVNKKENQDLVLTSACNYYENISQNEVESYYEQKKSPGEVNGPSWGLNSKLIKKDGKIIEQTWRLNGTYHEAIKEIIYWLRKAQKVCENTTQQEVISLLITYYETGDLRIFDKYSIKWLEENAGSVDFINGFIEVYGDPLGIKGSWEALVEYVDEEGSKRTSLISQNAQWFEDHSPIDPRFKKEEVKGVVAKVICAAMLGGDEYPSTAIGINLPNADWIRAQHGSKSITISNITEAYNQAGRNNGFLEEFVIDENTLNHIKKYGETCDNLHTDLHECLGHGSGKLLPEVDPDTLKKYGDVIEEARADLFALYFLASPKLMELGLLNDPDAYQAEYYSYMMNGLLTQLTRIKPGEEIEEAHMRNRALIARWIYRNTTNAMELVQKGEKTYLKIHSYTQIKDAVGKLLAEIQRIKSEGDYEAARTLIEEYAVKIDPQLHNEIRQRYQALDLSPYKGFINPHLTPVYNESNEIVDIKVDYTEAYDQQMLRYSREFGFL